jgi:hypothetical protein
MPLLATLTCLVALRGGQGSPPNLPDLIERVKPSVVSLRVDVDDKMMSTGTGFIVSTDGRVVTAAHVVEKYQAIEATFDDGTKKKVPTVEYVDAERDIAILKLEPGTYKPCALGDSNTIRDGDTVLAIGSPYGLAFTSTIGIVSARRPLDWQKMLPKGTPPTYIQFSAAISPGNSGGPLFDLKGNVIGVNVFKRKEGENLNFAVAINEVKSMLTIQRQTGTERWVVVSSKRKKPLTDQAYVIYRGENLMEAKKEIQERLDNGWRITNLAEGTNRWVVLYAKGINYGEQQLFRSTTFPTDEIKKRWSNGYYVTTCVYGTNAWNIVFTKSSEFKNQSYNVSSVYDKEWVQKKWADGFTIATLETSGPNIIHLMDQKSDSRVDTSWTTATQIDQKQIREKKEKKEFLVSVHNFKGDWLLVFARDPEIEDQSVTFGNVYPEEWIKAQWKKGWDITVIR